MEMTPSANRIHPLIAGAAVSVTLVSLLGAAAIAGFLPSSHGTSAGAAPLAPQAAVMAPVTAPVAPVLAPTSREVVEHKTVVHHQYAQQARPVQVAQTEVVRQPPAAQNSPVGIGVGAVVGGLLGSQVGGGNGRTLATIAGAVGGGYVGNEIAKRNQ